MAKVASSKQLYDEAFIKELPAFDRRGNPYVVAMLKEPAGKSKPAAAQIAQWYENLPGEWKLHYCNRLRSKTDETFIPAVWELHVHHFLSSIAGLTVQDLEHNSAHSSIDYLVEYDGHVIACEALALLPSQRDRRLEKRVQVFREEAEALLPPGYILSVSSFAGELKSQADAKRLAKWLAKEVRSTPRERGETIWTSERAPSRIGVHVLVADGEHQTHVVPIWSLEKDKQIERVLDRARRKARAKKPGHGPFLLFVGYRGVDLHDYDWLDLCYGRASFRLDLRSGYSLPLPRQGGLFTTGGRDDLRAAYLSGIVSSPIILSPEGNWQFSQVAYLNPFADFPVAADMLVEDVPVWTREPGKRGELKRVEPEPKWSSEVWSIINTIRDQYKPDKIVVFGSRASGQPTQDSDLDLLVVKETDEPQPQRDLDVSSLLYPRQLPVDIIVKTPQEIAEESERKNSFIKLILSTGKVIYERAGS